MHLSPTSKLGYLSFKDNYVPHSETMSTYTRDLRFYVYSNKNYTKLILTYMTNTMNLTNIKDEDI